jgi:hypothetical protein
MRSRFAISILLLLTLILLVGCSKSQPPATNTTENSATPSQPPGATANQSPSAMQPEALAAKPSAGAERIREKPAATPKTVTIPAGTVLTVRLAQALGSKISQPGQNFSATLARSIEIDGEVVVPAGAEATGTVAEAVPQGRFKGGAVLRLTLDSLAIKGTPHSIQTASVTEATKGKGKRTAVLAGGGAGLGAIVGGLAGGGKGALIGALAGGGAGTAGAAFTGKKDVELPAESALSFKLTQPLDTRE